MNIIKSSIFIYIMILTTFMDGLPVFPSTYRPLFLWILIIFFPISIIYIKLKKNMLFILGSFIWMLVVSYILSIYHYYSYTGIRDYFPTILLFFVAYTSYSFFFSNIKYLKLRKILNRVGIFLIIIGNIELLCIYKILPIQIKQILNLIFTGSKFYPRFKLISAETSWASMTLLFFFVFYLNNKNYWKGFFISLLILQSFSTQGIISLLIIIFYYIFIYFNTSILKKLLWLIFLAMFSYFILIILKYLLIQYKMENLYFARRLFLIGKIKFNNIIYIDDSVFVRLVYPYIGIKIWISNIYVFLFGIGGGNYRLEFPNIIKNMFPNYYYTSSEIVYNINSLTAVPKNIYSRLVCEGGLIGAGLFFIGIYKIYKTLSQNAKNYFILLGVLYLQFDSYIYLLFPMILAMCLTYRQEM